MPSVPAPTSCGPWTACRAWPPMAPLPASRCAAGARATTSIFVDDFPLDKVVHFDQTIGEDDDIAGGGRFSIFAPNSVAGAEFLARWLGRGLRRAVRLPAAPRACRGRVDAGHQPAPGCRRRRVHLRRSLGAVGGHVGILHRPALRFRRVFELIGQEDIGTPEVTDVILKTTTQLGARATSCSFC
jgi:hypothetical protein